MIAADLQTLATPVDQLGLLPGNPRRGDVDALSASLEKFGQRKPIVARRDGTVIAGNHTLLAARRLGWTEVAVVWVDDDDTTAKAFALADNRIGALGGYDDEELAALIKDVGDVDAELLAAAGWADDAVTELLAGLEPDRDRVPITGDADDAPPPPADPITQPGDVWVLGPHRVLCGDATDTTAVTALLAGERADVLWTDPPYGVAYVGKTADALTLRNDGADRLPELLADAFTVATTVLRPGAPVYVCHPAGPLATVFASAFTGAGWSLRQNLVWVKDSLVLGHSDYHYRHEPLLYGFTPGGEGRLGRGGERWFGDNGQTSVFEHPRPPRSEDHPTMKPVGLITDCLANSCPASGVVYEPFGGSGSTLIAAHQHGASARVVELDPRYVDVICRRFQDATGTLPVLEATGAAHDFLQDA